MLYIFGTFQETRRQDAFERFWNELPNKLEFG
jgi:hypothetical protein